MAWRTTVSGSEEEKKNILWAILTAGNKSKDYFLVPHFQTLSTEMTIHEWLAGVFLKTLTWCLGIRQHTVLIVCIHVWVLNWNLL